MSSGVTHRTLHEPVQPSGGLSLAIRPLVYPVTPRVCLYTVLVSLIFGGLYMY